MRRWPSKRFTWACKTTWSKATSPVNNWSERSSMQIAPNVRVVILSGQDDETLAIKAVHMGVQDYLVKGDITSQQLERALLYADRSERPGGDPFGSGR